MSTTTVYTVRAYRYGWHNRHQYHVYAGVDKEKAIALAVQEVQERGGKYGVVVCEHVDKPGHESEPKVIEYVPSCRGEKHLEFDHTDHFWTNLGHLFQDFAEGEVWVPINGEMQKIKTDPPAWAKNCLEREREIAKQLCDAFEHLDSSPASDK